MQKLRETMRRLRSVLRWSGKLLWQTDRANCLLVAATSLTTATLAPLSVILMARIVSLVESGLNEGSLTAYELWPWIFAAGVIAVVATATTELSKYSNARLTEKVGLRARRDVLSHTAQLDLASLEQSATQNEISSVALEPGGVIVRSVTGLIDLAAAVIRLAGLAAIMLLIEPLWTVGILLASVPLVATGGMLSWARHRLRLQYAETRRWARYYSRHLTNHKVAPATRVLGLTELMLDRDAARHTHLHLAKRKIDRLELATKLATTAVAMVVLLAAIQAVIASAMQGTIELYRFLAFWGAAWRLAKDAPRVAASLSTSSKAWLSIDHLQKFLSSNPSQSGATRRLPEPLIGEIIVDRVSFRYPNAQQNALREVSLYLEPGETVAIVGHNGAGKTTLAKLIAGLYAPTSGEIRYDGVPHDQIAYPELYRRMAVVFQRALQFEASARENIALGDWRRLAKAPKQVEQLAAKLGVEEMIRALPQGYETSLGRMFGEHELSGGQWQKLAIARALACDPAIVLLDEPTAGLDVYAEAELHRCMQRLVKGRTAIIISHRFSTVRDADRIVVLDQGRLVEQGTHVELRTRSGIYAAMWNAHCQRAA